MADPISYVVGYSFSGFQSSNPAVPLPAVPLDAELADIAASITSLVGALADVRRADGNLRNGSVSWDGLSDDVKARITGASARVTVGDINMSAFATQPEAAAGVANDKLMTPLSVTYELDALRAFASQAEAQAATSASVVLSPLRGADLVAALRPFASQAQAQAGTDNTTVMTPLRTAQEMDALRPRFKGTANLTWGAIAAGASATQTITVTGALAGDAVALGLAAAGLAAGLIPQAWVSASNTVTVRITNVTGGSLTPHGGAATSYTAVCLR